VTARELEGHDVGEGREVVAQGVPPHQVEDVSLVRVVEALDGLSLVPASFVPVRLESPGGLGAAALELGAIASPEVGGQLVERPLLRRRPPVETQGLFPHRAVFVHEPFLPAGGCFHRELLLLHGSPHVLEAVGEKRVHPAQERPTGTAPNWRAWSRA